MFGVLQCASSARSAVSGNRGPRSLLPRSIRSIAPDAAAFAHVAVRSCVDCAIVDICSIVYKHVATRPIGQSDSRCYVSVWVADLHRIWRPRSAALHLPTGAPGAPWCDGPRPPPAVGTLRPPAFMTRHVVREDDQFMRWERPARATMDLRCASVASSIVNHRAFGFCGNAPTSARTSPLMIHSLTTPRLTP